MGSPAIPDDAVMQEIEKAKNAGLFIAHQRYSQEEHDEFSRIIREFNALYWRMGVQTWLNTRWRGISVLKAPTDLWIYQELIQRLRPDLIIETGTCYGGSALFMRDIMDMNTILGHVVTIDIDQSQIQQRAPGITYHLGSSVDPMTINYLKAFIASYRCDRVMVILDSNHEEAHVAEELALYAPLVSVGMPLIVEDSNNHPGPKAAIEPWFEKNNKSFKRDFMCEKFMLTFNRDGFFEKIG